MAPVPQFTRQEEWKDYFGEDFGIKGRVLCAEEDIKQLMRLAHFPLYDYAEAMFNLRFFLRP